MTKQERKLLLQDLCARLLYGVKVDFPLWHGVDIEEICDRQNNIKVKDVLTLKDITPYLCNSKEPPKPYLRPMSSMTEEEIKELKTLCSIYIPMNSPTIGFEDYGIVVFTHHLTNNTYSFKLNISVIDWLNKKMFDYRRLIEKGLALEAPEEMYKNK